jgi:hypothetical protein
MIAGHFARIFCTHRASKRRSIKASHDHADVEANDFCCVSRIIFLLGANGQKAIADFYVFVHCSIPKAALFAVTWFQTIPDMSISAANLRGILA